MAVAAIAATAGGIIAGGVATNGHHLCIRDASFGVVPTQRMIHDRVVVS